MPGSASTHSTSTDLVPGFITDAAATDGVVDVPTAKRTLAALAHGDSGGHREVIERAENVRDDVEQAAAFADEVGVDRLRRAMKETRDPETRRRGRRALAAFERYRRVARGDQFHRGHGTDLRRDYERGST